MLSNKYPSAVVFGLFETGLGVIQSLGRKNIMVYGIDYLKDIGYYSRYSMSSICPHPNKKRGEFKSWIENKFSIFSCKPIVFIASDDFLRAFSEERDFLNSFFEINLADQELIVKIEDKFKQYELAQSVKINAPITWVINNDGDETKLNNNDMWPIFVKGRDVTAWRKVYGGNLKGFVIRNYDEYIEKLKKAIDKSLSVIAQELITGNDNDHFKYCAYYDSHGEMKAEMCLQKIRQYPAHFGVGSCVVSVSNNELKEIGKSFLDRISFKGVGSVEFKRDRKDGKLKLIELNARYWQQNLLTEICGTSFAYINYCDLAKINLASQFKYRSNVKWINIFMDFSSFLFYYKEKKLKIYCWLKSISGKKVFSNFSLDDPFPFLHEVNFGLKFFRLPWFIFKRIF